MDSTRSQAASTESRLTQLSGAVRARLAGRTPDDESGSSLVAVADALDGVSQLLIDVDSRSRDTQRNVEDRESLAEFRMAEMLSALRGEVNSAYRKLADRTALENQALDERIVELTSRNDADSVKTERRKIRAEAKRFENERAAALEIVRSNIDDLLRRLRAETDSALGNLGMAIAAQSEHISEQGRRLDHQSERIAELVGRLDESDQTERIAALESALVSHQQRLTAVANLLNQHESDIVRLASSTNEGSSAVIAEVDPPRASLAHLPKPPPLPHELQGVRVSEAVGDLL